MTHTAELKYDAERGWLFVDGGTYSETLFSFPHVEAGDKAFWLAPHHAQQLCARWNALSGISTEAIEAGAVAELIEAAREGLALLRIGVEAPEEIERLSSALAKFAEVKP